MKLLKKTIIFSLNFNPLRFNELIKYYRRYLILPRLFGFYQSPSVKYRLSIIYEYLKYTYHCKENSNYVLNCVPRSFFKYYLSHKTRHYEFGENCIDKQLFYNLLEDNGFSIPLNFGVIKNGILTNLHDEKISLRINDQYSKVFLKKIMGSLGIGARVINKKEIDLSKFDGFLIQEVCQNHIDIKNLAPNNAFNTIRIHTYYSLKDESVSILAAHIKLAAFGNITDNISTGGIGVEINVESGKLSNYGFSEYNKIDIDRYPGSQILFKDFEVPYWEVLISQVTKAAKIMKTCLIGWDIGITQNGIVFIEGNSGSDIFIPQVFYKPFFDSKLIQDFIVDSNYHQWVKHYQNMQNKL